MNIHRKRLYNNDLIMTILSFSLVLIFWELLVYLFKVPKWLLPPPSAIVVEMFRSAGYLWHHSLITMSEILLGFAIAFVVGVTLGVLIAFFPLLEKTLYKFLVAIQTMPKVAIAPVLVVWLGLGQLSKIALVFLLCFFPIMVNMVSGLQSTSRELLELSDALGANWFQSFQKIRFPAALPYLFNGMRISVSLAVIGAIISEFVNANAGLGYSLLMTTSQLKGPLTFAVVTILAIIGISLFTIVSRLERLICPWAKTTNTEDYTE